MVSRRPPERDVATAFNKADDQSVGRFAGTEFRMPAGWFDASGSRVKPPVQKRH
jgi:hypothetical protein